jgi:hypothetical protein
MSCGICGGQSGTWAGFLRVLRFPLPIFIPPVAPQSLSSIIRGWYNRPVVAAVPSGLSLSPLRIIIIKNNRFGYRIPSNYGECCSLLPKRALFHSLDKAVKHITMTKVTNSVVHEQTTIHTDNVFQKQHKTIFW